MEPQELAKKDEGSGFSRRRISSILKGTRKSARFSDPKQQENVVERTKPVEKRNSRRVSFAPANDVLLFSKDVKNASPARSPLQELMTAAGATAQNRVQVVVAEDGIPQTTAMETLLNAPLHASQQDKVSFNTAEGLGEKTVVFSTDDAFMDMTHSQTMILATYADTSLQICDALPAGAEKKVMFTADDPSTDLPLNPVDRTNSSRPPGRKKDLSAENRNVSSKVSSLDRGFEEFLASLSKPGGPSSVETNVSLAPVKTQKAAVEKENLLPTSVSAVMEKSLSEPRKSEQHGLCPDADVSMNLTEVQTGRILSVTDEDNPFQCLFPTQDMYAHSEKRESQTVEVMMTKSDPKAVGATEKRFQKVIIDDKSQLVPDMTSSKKSAPNASHPRCKVNFNARDECTDKTIRFTAGDEFMDMTQSHTVNIARGPLAPKQVSTEGLEAGFGNFLTGLSKPTVPSVNPGIERVEPLAINRSLCELKAPMPDAGKENWSLKTSRSCRESTIGAEVFPDVDMTMEMTGTQTGHILEAPGSGDPFHFLFPTQDMYPHSENLKTAEMSSGQKNSKALGFLKHAGLHTQDKLVPEDDHREKTVRFSAEDACMDVTRSHTVRIGTDFNPTHLGSLSSARDKTIRFSVNDAGMDMTRCLTVNIANNLGAGSVLLSEKKQESEKRGPLGDRSSSAHGLDPESNSVPSVGPAIARRTSTAPALSHMRDPSDGGTICPEDDVSMNMDMTEAQTGRILGFTHTGDSLQCVFPPQDIYPQRDHVETAETTSGRKSREALGSTQRTSFEMRRSQVKFDAEDDCSEDSVRTSPDDAASNVTDCLDVNTSESVLPPQETNTAPAHKDMDLHVSGKKRGRSLSARSLDPGFKNSLSRMSCPWVHPVKKVTPAGKCPPEGADTNDHLQIQKPGVEATNAATEKSQNKTMTDFTDHDQSMEMTEARTACIFGPSCTDELPQDSDPKFELLEQTEKKLQQSDETASVEITNSPESVDSNEIVTRKEPESRNETTSSQKMEDGSSLSALDRDLETLGGSRKSRRMSLADIQSKVRRLSHMINTAPEALAVESCTESWPQLDDNLEKTSKDRTKPLHALEPELQMSLESNEETTQDQFLTRGGGGESPAPATPVNLKTKHLMSRLSVGGFRPKLPQLSKPSDPKGLNSAGEPTRTFTANVTTPQSNCDNDVSDIFDEELNSWEDVSETLNPRSPKRIPEKASPLQEGDVDLPERDVDLPERDVFEEDLSSTVNRKKRPLSNDENSVKDEKRMKASTEEPNDINDMESQSHFAECDGTSAPNVTAHASDCSSSSHTATVRCEATFESTFKHSMFESQLEDYYTSDAQKKLADGTITVLEFFKLFNIDFVIHNPRQSVLPGRILSDTEHTEMDVLRDRHICRPKQTVYETDVLSLTEKVEGLKVRLQDLHKPLKMVNQHLWDDMRNTSEKELKSFGAALKERNSFFRKTSKVLSHEMKEVLYSNLVQANLEEQQKLRGTIREADEMIKRLDDCICELEAEVAAVEETGVEGKPSLKSRQEEMKKVTEALADNEKQMAELELQKKHSSTKLTRLKTETRNLESHIAGMHMVNEWRLGEKQENCSVYTFLHETVHLQLVYDKSEADHESERKISHINFKLQLDDERSRCHARLVHKLLSQYVDGETSWVEKYPTSSHVPKLLHDVGLVVSRCRLLGEELRLLKMWGGLHLDILDISCVDTQVHIVFSSLRKLSKFEVVLSVGLIDRLCVVRVESFNNVIGGAVLQQIEEVVASFSPTKNLLTKIIKKIHDRLLC